MFETPFDWVWVNKDEVEWIAKFKSEQHNYTISLKHILNQREGIDFWDASYGVGYNEDQSIITNEYNSQKVLSTVITTYATFMNERQPNKVVIASLMSNRLNRSSVYQKLVTKFIPENYEPYVQPMNDGDRIIMQRNQ